MQQIYDYFNGYRLLVYTIAVYQHRIEFDVNENSTDCSDCSYSQNPIFGKYVHIELHQRGLKKENTNTRPSAMSCFNKFNGGNQLRVA